MLNSYFEQNSNYCIKSCEINEINDVMCFFGQIWSKEHIIATSRKFVDYQFFNKKNNNYNIIISRDLKDNSVIGMLAYIPNYHFDYEISKTDKFIWFTNWIVKENTYNGLGLKLYNGLMKHENTKLFGILGINEIADRIYKAMKYKMGSLKHYFIVNHDADLQIISNYNKKAESFPSGNNPLEKIENLETLNCSFKGFPVKTKEFLKNKYINNPFYNYYCYGIKNNNEFLNAIVFRKISYNNVNIIRMVEYFGNPDYLKNSYNSFQNLLSEFRAEYLDFYCFGINDEILFSSGFELNQGQKGLIIPNYFEPFLKENITINFAYNTKEQSFIIFKGDGDRDHPRDTSNLEVYKSVCFKNQ